MFIFGFLSMFTECKWLPWKPSRTSEKFPVGAKIEVSQVNTTASFIIFGEFYNGLQMQRIQCQNMGKTLSNS
jgi:hypothetical protein